MVVNARPVTNYSEKIFRNQHSCLWCESNLFGKNKRHIITKDWANNGNEIYSYIRCERCHSWALLNPPVAEQLGLYYSQDYEPYAASSIDVLPLDLPSALEELIKSDKSASINIVDYGCGNGQWLARAAKTFARCNLYAVDFDKESTVQRLEWLNRPINVINPVEFGQLQQKFHLINFGHSLEHLENPVNTIQVASKLLADKAVITIACPVSDSISFSLFRSFWIHLDAPRHLSIPSIAALRIVLKSAGTQVFMEGSYGSPSGGLRSINLLNKYEKVLLINLYKFLAQLPSKVPFMKPFEGLVKSSKYSIIAVKPSQN